jgi:hypothetical protein
VNERITQNFNTTLKRLEECSSTVLRLLRSLRGFVLGVINFRGK